MAQWTSRRWFTTVLVAMVLLIAAAALVGATALARTTAVSNRLNDHIAPARTEVARLETALVKQQMGMRGYLDNGEPDLLEPYAEGFADERASVARLRELLAGEPSALAEVDAVEQRTGRWRESTADPLVQARPADDAAYAAALASSRTQSGEIQGRLAALEARLDSLRQEARGDLAASRSTRNTVFTGVLVALLLLIAAIAVLLRVVVLRPLNQLSGAVRRVAGGDFDHRLTPRGPADLARLGGDVEAMRRRLTDSLAASQRAREQLEQQQSELQRSNADLEQFAYVASHDLQEPLRKVASFCQMLQRRYADALDERAQQYIGFAVDGATRMQQLINDLLSFSRIGRFYDARHPVRLDAVLDDVERALALAIEETGAVLIRSPLPTVLGDTTLLTMLWQNLIGNAIKFRRPDEPPRITIDATEHDGLWHFSVADNGIGIEPEFADKIFVIFQRLHPRDAYPGTGIGLAVCKKIVEHHGGTIRLDDGYTGGARILCTLPAGGDDGPQRASVDQDAG